MEVALTKYILHYNKRAEEASLNHRIEFHNFSLTDYFAKETLHMLACGPIAK
jgi:hypothetical protein